MLPEKTTGGSRQSVQCHPIQSRSGSVGGCFTEEISATSSFQPCFVPSHLVTTQILNSCSGVIFVRCVKQPLLVQLFSVTDFQCGGSGVGLPYKVQLVSRNIMMGFVRGKHREGCKGGGGRRGLSSKTLKGHFLQPSHTNVGSKHEPSPKK